MKKTLLHTALLLMGCSAASHAQIAASLALPNALHYNNHGTAHAANDKHAHARTTIIPGSRWIGEMVQEYVNDTGYAKVDSAWLKYSGTRTGYIETVSKYDSAQTFIFDSVGGIHNDQRYTHHFDASSNILSETGQNWDATALAWVNNYEQIYTYDGSNNILTDLRQTWSSGAWINSDQDTYTYDGSNNMLTDVYQDWNTTTSAWDNQRKYTYTYTSANKIAIETQLQWNSTTSTWDNDTKYTYTYDAANNQIGYLYQGWDNTSSTWTNYNQDIYTYDASNDQLTDVYQDWNTATSGWVNDTKTINSSFVDMQPQLSQTQNWNDTTSTFVNSYESLIAYNSFDEITNVVSREWNAANNNYMVENGDENTTLYYEDISSAVKTVASAGGQANIYPVPVNSSLRVELSWTMTQAFTIEVYDMQGSCVSRSEQPAMANYHGNISTANFAAGNYVIKINGTNGQVIKQFVVVH